MVGAHLSPDSSVLVEQPGREDRRLRTALEAELGQHVRHVVLDRLLGEEQPVPDLAVGEPLSDKLENAPLLRGSGS